MDAETTKVVLAQFGANTQRIENLATREAARRAERDTIDSLVGAKPSTYVSIQNRPLVERVVDLIAARDSLRGRAEKAEDALARATAEIAALKVRKSRKGRRA